MSNNPKDNSNFNTDEIDEIIVGRVKPHIYAFSTNTVPNYLKVGDTYRPVNVRLNEWRKRFSDLSPEYDRESMVSDDTFFRDYSVHDYLENTLGKQRLKPEDITEGGYYSNEFFGDTSTSDIETAIEDIVSDYSNKAQRYQYYTFNERPTPVLTRYASTGTWTPRPNQQDVINRFKAAVSNGRTNLLLYAVMRFGKTFTSMCCANEIDAKTVLIVSAKADVKEEWRMTIQSADNFNDYEFIDAKQLAADEKLIQKTLKSNKRAAIFLTLEDLQGDTIKTKHKEVFSNEMDLLLIDETHFGARAEQYGKVLREAKEKTDDSVDFEDAENSVKTLHAKIRMHLSGTPYRILMSSEFGKEDIVGFCQASDILDAKDEWDTAHFDDIDNGLVNPSTGKRYQEWDNPYFGFPQMVRFAFSPSKRIRDKIVELQEKGINSKLNKIFEPKSVTKDSNENYKSFVFADEILDFLKVIDGIEDDDELFGFLDYDKIKDGKLCRHMVFVLPYRASCDAMEELLTSNSAIFKNLSDYKIINISGVGNPNKYRTVNDVKNAIKQHELNDEKTITLTVNRMLTGSTVREWDTMLYLKDTSSPQEYDQAIFRLQNQFVEKYESSDDSDEVKIDKKPQTLLIDFSPNRIFTMQEARSLIYNANVGEKGRDALIKQISKEVSYFPIITINKNRMKSVQAVDLITAIDNYSRERGIYDEAQEIPIDYNLLSDDDIRQEIEKQGEFRGHQGFELISGDDDDEFETPTDDDVEQPQEQDGAGENTPTDKPTQDADNLRVLERQFKTYYSRILFYSALTDDSVDSLNDIIQSIDSNNDNKRIASNLDLNKDILSKMSVLMDTFAGYKLDSTIARINRLSNDKSLTPLERAQTAIKQFDRLSKSEVVTPQEICERVVDTLSSSDIINHIQNGGSVLDIASKKAEFALSLVNRLQKSGVNIDKYRRAIYSIPTSKIAYEFTRKIYKTLGLDIDTIATNFTSYDILKDFNKDEESWNEPISEAFSKKKGEIMKFDAIVGNPPYQEETAKKSSRNGQTPRKNIFHYFQIAADSLSSDSTCLIYPGARWIHRSGKGLKQFGLEQINDKRLAKIDFYPNSKDIFKEIDVIPDGISIVYKKSAKNTDKFDYVYHDNGAPIKVTVSCPGESLIPLNPNDVSIVEKVDTWVTKNKLKYLNESVKPRTLFGIESNFAQDNPDAVCRLEDCEDIDYSVKVKLFTNDKAGPAGRACWFVTDKTNIPQGTDYIDKYKVVVSSAHPGGQEGRDNCLEIIDDKSVFGRSRVALKIFDSKTEAENFYKYCKSAFVKFMLLMTDEALSSLGKRVPDILDYKQTNSLVDFKKDLDTQLFKLCGFNETEVNHITKTVNGDNKEAE